MENHQKKSFVYKKVDDLELISDVYLPGQLNLSYTPTVIVHFHGGGLTSGDRNLLSPEYYRQFLQENWIYISFDYRLAPETKLLDLWRDCEDHWKWLLEDLPKLLQIREFDPSRIGMLGFSAGGYLALLSGYKLQPQPACIVNFYGIASIDSDQYTKPNENVPPEMKISEEVYLKLIEPRPIAGVPFFTADWKPTPRFAVCGYLLQKGLFVKEVFGLDVQQPEELEKLYLWKPARHVTPSYPPTILLHGTKDTVVPFSESVEMVEALKKHGVEHQFVVVEGQGHAYYFLKSDPNYALHNALYVDPALHWFKKYLIPKK